MSTETELPMSAAVLALQELHSKQLDYDWVFAAWGEAV